MNTKVDAFFRKIDNWKDELEKLREVFLQSDLTEEYKWRQPCYTWKGSNVAILGSYSEGATLSFFKGVLLDDPHELLEKAGPNTRSARVIRFTSVEEITGVEKILMDYIKAAIELEKEGKEVDFKKNRIPDYPEELQEQFDQDPDFKEAFEDLTPGRKRGYVLHFSGAKQSRTRTRRIKKYRDKIFEGKGMNER